MKKNKILVFTALILIICGIIGALFTFEKEKAIPFEIERTEESSFNSIDVKAENATLEVKRTNKKEARVVFNGSQKENKKPVIKTSVKDNEWNISIKEPRAGFINLDFITMHEKLTIYLPQKEYERIFLSTDNGRIVVDQLTGNDVHAESNNGRIEMLNVTADKIKARTDNGRLFFENSTGQIYGRSNNRKIEYDGDFISQNTDLETDNGRIEIKMRNQKQAKQLQIDAETDNGSIYLFGKKYKKHTVLQGTGPSLRLKTNNGRIEVN